MKIPIITIFTKVDLISEEETMDCIKLFKYTLKKFNINKNPIIIRNLEDAELFSRNIYEKIIPIFTVRKIKK
jgi:GTPase